MGEGENNETNAKFNMAIATLKRIDAILQQIANLDMLSIYDTIEKQKAHLSLVKNLYIMSSPLFDQIDDKNEKKKLNKLKDEILKTSLISKKIIKNGNQKIKFGFNQDLDLKLQIFTIEIQNGLKKFFMPRNDEYDDGY